MNKFRSSGILLPIFSLPSPYGVGTLGKVAYDFIDFLSSTGSTFWQILPLNVTSYGDSPYQSPSSVGLNYYFIDLDVLIEKGLLHKEDIDGVELFTDKHYVSYGLLFNNRIPLLKKAFSRFNKDDSDFQNFEKEGTYKDFAFYMTVKTLQNHRPWYEWDEYYKTYSPELEEKVLAEHKDLYLFYVWTQYEFLDEYFKLKNYANLKGIKIIGDLPLYLSYDSVEAYKYPQLFQFDEKHQPVVVAGCPPDAFTEDGQLWGNPIYDWDSMEKDGYSFFNNRINYNLKLFDIVRIDHFRGFSSYYAIPYGRSNARVGKWIKGPGMKLFKGKENLPIIAEDLGVLDDDVLKLLKDTTYPGMKILEFAFDGDKTNMHLPSNITENFFCYTGTHDNMPLLGYLLTLSEKEFSVFKKMVKEEAEKFSVPYDDSSLPKLVRTVASLCYATKAEGAILIYQDVLALGKESRINFPSSLSTSNWSYRFTAEQFNDEVREFIKGNNERYNRH